MPRLFHYRGAASLNSLETSNMPRTLGGLVGFVVMATVTVVVGNFVWARFVGPMIASLRKAA